MLKDIRAVQWVEGKKVKKTRWEIQIRREGSKKWEPMALVRINRRPKHVQGVE